MAAQREQSVADIFSKQKRSEVMSHIRSRGNRSTELTLAKLLRNEGISGWRLLREKPVTPDFLFLGRRICVFVDGCFWHGCPKCFRQLASNVAYWRGKIARNRQRDRDNRRALRRAGYRVFRIWECSLRRPHYAKRFAARLQTALHRFRPQE